MANFMGPMAPPQAAQPQPQKLDVRTNPAQRAQFKSFMSSMSAPAMPTSAPIAPMLSAPNPMDQIDIFDSVQAMASGGVVGGLEDLGQMSSQMVEALNTVVYGGGQGGGMGGMQTPPSMMPPPLPDMGEKATTFPMNNAITQFPSLPTKMSPGISTGPGMDISDMQSKYDAAVADARKQREGGFMGRVMLPGEMSFDDFSEFNSVANTFEPLQGVGKQPLQRGQMPYIGNPIFDQIRAFADGGAAGDGGLGAIANYSMPFRKGGGVTFESGKAYETGRGIGEQVRERQAVSRGRADYQGGRQSDAERSDRRASEMLMYGQQGQGDSVALQGITGGSGQAPVLDALGKILGDGQFTAPKIPEGDAFITTSSSQNADLDLMGLQPELAANYSPFPISAVNNAAQRETGNQLLDNINDFRADERFAGADQGVVPQDATQSQSIYSLPTYLKGLFPEGSPTYENIMDRANPVPSTMNIFGKEITAPSVANVVGSAIGGANVRNIISKIDEGGKPILDDQGNIQGVVHDGFFGGKVYSGNTAFNPFSTPDARDDEDRLILPPMSPLPEAQTPLTITPPVVDPTPPVVPPNPTDVIVPSTRTDVPVNVPVVAPTPIESILPQNLLDLLQNRQPIRSFADGGAVLDDAAGRFLEALTAA
ncbi:hypothetical protein OAE49_06390 [Gammaproteobacteria bacterium]|nr:hypothetical protein [Gammaproteobacteria bacterium]